MTQFLLLFFITLSCVLGGGLYWSINQQSQEESSSGSESRPSSPVSSEKSLQEESFLPDETLQKLSQEVAKNIQSELQLNLDMVAQLRSHQYMLAQLKEYATEVSKDIQLIEEISQDEFQENVTLQASLLKGKKPALIAQHLQEFSPIRAGAILSKLKEREASKVFDVWASTGEETFYRDTITAYLKNRRKALHPELFESFKKEDNPNSS